MFLKISTSGGIQSGRMPTWLPVTEITSDEKTHQDSST